MILHPVALPHTTRAALWTHRSFKRISALWPLGTTYYFGHKIAEVETIFGHHGAQDLSDWLGRFGFQPHGAVNGNQVQSRSKHRAQVNVIALKA